MIVESESSYLMLIPVDYDVPAMDFYSSRTILDVCYSAKLYRLVKSLGTKELDKVLDIHFTYNYTHSLSKSRYVLVQDLVSFSYAAFAPRNDAIWAYLSKLPQNLKS